jgi:Trypsin
LVLAVGGEPMPRLLAPLLLFLFAAVPAHAVVKGSASAQGRYTVRLVGNGVYCSGVVIARNAVATAAHCARIMHVIAGSRSFRVASVSRTAVLDDGRRVNVSGDAAILRLAAPLPADVDAAPVGDGSGDSYTIAGYGTTDERWRVSFGPLHEATLVAEGPHALVDPDRAGSIGASACFGDSGGPVLRGGMLVGVISRAAHPSPHLACGHLTRWAPVTASDAAMASADEAATVEQPRPDRRKQSAQLKRMPMSAAGAFNLFGAAAPLQGTRLARRSIRNEFARR